MSLINDVNSWIVVFITLTIRDLKIFNHFFLFCEYMFTCRVFVLLVVECLFPFVGVLSFDITKDRSHRFVFGNVLINLIFQLKANAFYDFDTNCFQELLSNF